MKHTAKFKSKGNVRRMSSGKDSHKAARDRRTNGERRRAADKRRAHDRFTPGQGSNERRQSERRLGRN